jgi:hypothetical protein
MLQSTDISNALEKIVEHLDNSGHDNPKITIEDKNPFALRMRMHKYIKAFKMQMKDKKGIDENKYDHLLMTSNLEGIVVSSVLENKPLILIDEEGKEL